MSVKAKPKSATQDDSPINSALRQFEATEANLAKLERIWARITEQTPRGLQFGNDPAYDELIRNYEDIVKALPKINGWKPEDIPMDLNAIGQCRLDAKEVGEIEAEIAVNEQIEAPGRELAKYRHLLNRKRRQLIRSVMSDRIDYIDEILRSLSKALPKSRRANVKSPDWEKLREQVQEIDALLGGAIARPSRWNDLQRHLHFGMAQDLLDIIRLDWPEVKPGLQKALYGEDEPLPVEVADLDTLASAQPKGEVITKLKWKSLTDEDFERLIFSIISSTPGYENPEWLIHTKAQDRGRDLSVYRVIHDPLSGTIRNRVLIQCRNWLARSISTSDVAQLKEQITIWEPPKIDVLIIATTGRFTSDAVAAIERHNAGDRALRIDMWPESHLEGLLAKRPALIAEFRLR
jgi:hypothetical protein